MLVKTYSSTVFGINATTITIEVNLEIGINFYLVGLPDNAVKESQQRIKAAFKNNNLKFPGREITVNMAPADIRKEGSVFDLPIAIGILAVSKQVKLELLMPSKDKMFSLRISEKLLEEYREFCEENSINISKRLRKFIERDLEGHRARKLQQQIQQQQKNNSQS